MLQEGAGRSEPKPSAADEAIAVLASAYKSSGTSEIAKSVLRSINEMVGILSS